jgi:hypothetical protein
MAVRILIAAVLSALAMFMWGFVFWGPVLNQSSNLMSPFPPEAEVDVLAPLRRENTPDGMYVYPGPLTDMGDADAQKVWEKKLAEGPVIHMAYHEAGVSPMDPMMLAKGFGHSFVIALISGIVLAIVAEALPSYAGRVGLLVLVSLIAAIWTNVGNVIWWFHTPKYGAGQVIYTWVAGLLMALITAGIVWRPADAR